jgi:hypothetical protein
VSIFVEDESRFGLIPLTRRRITAKGVKPVQGVQQVFESYYVYGAVEPLTGEGLFLEMPRLDSDCFQVFLNEFSRNYSDRFIIIMLDNGGLHKAKKLVIPENMVLLFLPPYSPELNPIERLWQDMKESIGFWLYETLEGLKEKVAEVLKQYTPSAIASLTGYSYLIKAVNALLS